MLAVSFRRWNFCENLAFLEKRPLTGNFSKFCSKRFHRDTDRRVACKFHEILPTGDRWNGALLTWQKFALLSRSTVRIAPKICQEQPPTMYSERSIFLPSRFTFGRVIAERVNTVKKRRKVNPIFGWSDSFKPNNNTNLILVRFGFLQ